MQSDTQLLAEYAASSSEAAFTELVHRHADLVYSAALRQLGETELARDVAQSVFADLARKAATLPPGTVLAGWLHRSTRYAALNELRNSRRRQHREHQAMQDLPASTDDASWDHIQPLLDDAIASLGEPDRDALLLRYFKNETFATVGTTLGVSEDAAQKRVSRAVEKLREFLAARGVRTSVASLAALLAAHSVQAAPLGLASTLATGALAGTTAGVVTTQVFAASKLKLAAALALAAAFAGLVTVQQSDRDSLRQSQASLTKLNDDLQRLRTENARLAALSTNTAELEKLRREAADVYRLRGEASVLRQELAALKSRPASPATTTPPAPATPEASADRTQVCLAAKFVSVPSTLLQQGDLRRFSLGTGSVITPQECKSLILFLEQTEGVDILASPTALTMNGRQAQMKIGTATSLVDPLTREIVQTNIGPQIDFTPFANTNTGMVKLDVAIRLSEIVDQSPQQDGSQPGFNSSQSALSDLDLASGHTFVLSQSLDLNRQRLQTSNTTGTAPAAASKAFLVIITPTIMDDKGFEKVFNRSAAGK